MSQKLKNLSPLMEAVLSLDTYLAEIVRLGTKIEGMDLKTDEDADHAQRLMNRFAECSDGISQQIAIFSQALQTARAEAELAAQKVAARAELLQSRTSEKRQQMDAFQALGEKVRDLTVSLHDLKPTGDVEPSVEERARIAARLADVEIQIQPLIQEARELQMQARTTKQKEVEQKADALAQSLTAVSRKLETFKEATL